MILTALFLTAIFVTAAALCSRGSFQLGLIASNPDAIRTGYTRVVFNLVGQTILVFSVQLGISLFVASFPNANALFVLTLAYWGVTTVVAITLGILGYVTNRANIGAIESDLSNFVPGGGFAAVMDLDITWRERSSLSYRAYRSINMITLPSVWLCAAIGVCWAFRL